MRTNNKGRPLFYRITMGLEPSPQKENKKRLTHFVKRNVEIHTEIMEGFIGTSHTSILKESPS